MHFRSHACVISQMTSSGRTAKSRDLNAALPVSLTLFGRISSREGLPLATSRDVWHADVYRMVETVSGKRRERCEGSAWDLWLPSHGNARCTAVPPALVI